ncbi:pectinesterase 3-like [Zingiber officinale]|uniref:pectinesterase 3-like n=1 Tax=Zingiber officinale TaxID=94328 RepID=UPI001C4AFA36|nr:pectinesterase 3-like [Zingiber officinale]
MTTSKQLTCNTFAVIGSLSSFLSLIKINGGSGSRRLLAKDHRLIGEDVTPNATVAKDGSRDFKTIFEVLAKILSSYNSRYVIYVKEGVYEEQVVVDLISVSIYSDNSRKSVIIRSKNFIDDTTLSETTTFEVYQDTLYAHTHHQFYRGCLILGTINFIFGKCVACLLQ